MIVTVPSTLPVGPRYTGKCAGFTNVSTVASGRAFSTETALPEGAGGAAPESEEGGEACSLEGDGEPPLQPEPEEAARRSANETRARLAMRWGGQKRIACQDRWPLWADSVAFT